MPRSRLLNKIYSRCIICKKEFLDGSHGNRKYCSKNCLGKRNNAVAKELSLMRKNKGLCRNCDKTKLLNKVFCESCYKKQAILQKKYNRKKRKENLIKKVENAGFKQTVFTRKGVPLRGFQITGEELNNILNRIE